MRGCKRFLDRVAQLAEKAKGSGVTKALEAPFHRTIKKVSSDIEEMNWLSFKIISFQFLS